MDLKEAVKATPRPLIKHFKTWTGTKWRTVAEPQEPLKTALKETNAVLSVLYEELLKENGLKDIPQAYRAGHSVKDNAKIHARNRTWYRYDFSGFYDTVRFEDFAPRLEAILPDIMKNANTYRDAFIDPDTNGLTQGSPTSGVLAGIACIPFWLELKRRLPKATITQYSDDLCVSGTRLSQWETTREILDAIHTTGLQVRLNDKKTRVDTDQHRRLTGVSCNADNQLTPRRQDYRTMRSIMHNMKTKGAGAIPEESSACKILGQLAYMKYIDTTGKIEKLETSYADVVEMLKQMQKEELCSQIQ